MIVRILTARVRERNAATVEALLRRQLDEMRQYDGLRYLKLARQVHQGYEDVLLFEEWRDIAALHGWAGPSLEAPRVVPEARPLLEELQVTHYEALDIEVPIPDDWEVEPVGAAAGAAAEAVPAGTTEVGEGVEPQPLERMNQGA